MDRPDVEDLTVAHIRRMSDYLRYSCDERDGERRFVSGVDLAGYIGKEEPVGGLPPEMLCGLRFLDPRQVDAGGGDLFLKHFSSESGAMCYTEFGNLDPDVVNGLDLELFRLRFLDFEFMHYVNAPDGGSDSHKVFVSFEGFGFESAAVSVDDKLCGVSFHYDPDLGTVDDISFGFNKSGDAGERMRFVPYGDLDSDVRDRVVSCLESYESQVRERLGVPQKTVGDTRERFGVWFNSLNDWEKVELYGVLKELSDTPGFDPVDRGRLHDIEFYFHEPELPYGYSSVFDVEALDGILGLSVGSIEMARSRFDARMLSLDDRERIARALVLEPSDRVVSFSVMDGNGVSGDAPGFIVANIHHESVSSVDDFDHDYSQILVGDAARSLDRFKDVRCVVPFLDPKFFYNGAFSCDDGGSRRFVSLDKVALNEGRYVIDQDFILRKGDDDLVNLLFRKFAGDYLNPSDGGSEFSNLIVRHVADCFDYPFTEREVDVCRDALVIQFPSYDPWVNDDLIWNESLDVVSSCFGMLDFESKMEILDSFWESGIFEDMGGYWKRLGQDVADGILEVPAFDREAALRFLEVEGRRFRFAHGPDSFDQIDEKGAVHLCRSSFGGFTDKQGFPGTVLGADTGKPVLKLNGVYREIPAEGFFIVKDGAGKLSVLKHEDFASRYRWNGDEVRYEKVDRPEVAPDVARRREATKAMYRRFCSASRGAGKGKKNN